MMMKNKEKFIKKIQMKISKKMKKKGKNEEEIETIH